MSAAPLQGASAKGRCRGALQRAGCYPYTREQRRNYCAAPLPAHLAHLALPIPLARALRRRGTGAQPHLVLTHYTEMMSDKDAVLVGARCMLPCIGLREGQSSSPFSTRSRVEADGGSVRIVRRGCARPTPRLNRRRSCVPPMPQVRGDIINPQAVSRGEVRPLGFLPLLVAVPPARLCPRQLPALLSCPPALLHDLRLPARRRSSSHASCTTFTQ